MKNDSATIAKTTNNPNWILIDAKEETLGRLCSKIANMLFLTCVLLSEFLSCHEGRVSQFRWHQQGIVQNNQYLKLYLSVGFIMTTFIHIGINKNE